MTSKVFGKENPFLASIKERYWLSNPPSLRRTYHITLDLRGSGYTYEVGDSIAIYSTNNQKFVENILNALEATGFEEVKNRNGESDTLRNFLSNKGNITDISRKLLMKIVERQTNPEKQHHLSSLADVENKENLKTYLSVRQAWDFLLENHEVHFSPQEFVDLLMPLLPRFYSIASSSKCVGNEVHLTVAGVRYNSNGHERLGVCSDFLCEIAPLHQPIVPVYIQPHRGFTLPENIDSNIIMIGPGTGIAPFRAFMQERAHTRGKGKNWLFFGEWRLGQDYYYRDFWEQLQKEELLQIDTAFSRDQEHKIYVQHRMYEKGEELYFWLEKGAYLFVCGDAHRMAKDVEATLHQIIETHGNKTTEEARQYIKQLRAEKKYLRDIY